MNEYARATGKETLSPGPSPASGRGEKNRPRELSEAEKEQVACTKLRVELHMPELVPLIKEFHEAGMIDGWRNVKNFRFKEGI